MILTIGSIKTDISIKVKKTPAPGENIIIMKLPVLNGNAF